MVQLTADVGNEFHAEMALGKKRVQEPRGVGKRLIQQVSVIATVIITNRPICYGENRRTNTTVYDVIKLT